MGRKTERAKAATARARTIETDPSRLSRLAEPRLDTHLNLRTYLKGHGAEAETDALFGQARDVTTQ